MTTQRDRRPNGIARHGSPAPVYKEHRALTFDTCPHERGSAMPFRTISPWRRPWWEVCTGIWFALFIMGGVYGLLYPSVNYGLLYPSVNIATVFLVAQMIYSGLIIFFGAAALLAWWFGHRDPERIAMHTLAALTFVHGIGVWASIGDTAAQTGLRIIAAAIGTVAWTELRHHFGMTRKAVQEAVEMLPDIEPPGRE